jgi:predicted N-acetyltransferase YhbS
VSEIRIRPITDADADEVRELGARSVDGGRVSFRQQHHVPYAEALRARRPDSAGVVAVEPGGGFVGSGWVTFSRVAHGDDLLTLAWLHSLNVDPEWRGRGIARRLIDARLDLVGERRSEPVVVAAAIQAGNDASWASAQRWATDTLGTVRVTPVRPPRRAPRPSGFTLRAATGDDLADVSSSIARTAARMSLAPAPSADELAAWLDVRVGGAPLHEYVVAVDPAGRLVAGLGLQDEGRLMSLEVTSMPRSLVAANLVLRVVPRDRLLRNINVRTPFVEPGHEDALRALWRSARWERRDRCTGMVLAADPTGPIAAALRPPRWLPSTTLRIVARVPAGVALGGVPLGPAV